MRKLNESPDTVHFKNGDKIRWDNKDAIAFGYAVRNMDTKYLVDIQTKKPKFGRNTELIYGENSRPHYTIKESYPDYDEDCWTSPKYLLYPGRIWLDRHVISFWNAPKPQHRKEVIRDLEDAFRIKIIGNPEWIIEKDIYWFEVATSYATGKEISMRQWKITQHVKAGRMGRKVPDGVGSETHKFGKLSVSQAHQMMRTSEENKLKNIIRKHINESPDEVEFENGETIQHYQGESYAFGYAVKDGGKHKYATAIEKKPILGKNTKLLVSTEGQTHGYISKLYDIDWSYSEYLLYPGRIWLDKKVISFWEYPKTTRERKIVIDDLEDYFPVKIRGNPEWIIETGDYEFETAISYTSNKDIDYAKWKRTQHVKAGRFFRKVPDGVGSESKKYGKLSTTQAHQMMRTSEGKLRNIIKKIIRESFKKDLEITGK